VDHQLDSLVEKYASVLTALRKSCLVRTVEVHKGCLFVHAEAASEAHRTGLLRRFHMDELIDLRIAVSVNPALQLAGLNGRLVTGVGSIGRVGGALEVGPQSE
jgi:hypothetical protein